MESTTMPVISAKNLNLWYGDFKALKNISLDVGEREITASSAPPAAASHLPENAQPHERPCAGRAHRGRCPAQREDIFARDMELTDLRRRWVWCSRRQTPSP